MLQHRSQTVHGIAKAHRHEQDGNAIGCQSENWILNMHLYDIEFQGGEVTPLTVHIIAQALYAQCDTDGMFCRCTEVSYSNNPT